MLDFFETEFNWNYKIPKGVNIILDKKPSCPICRNDKFNLWSAPYIIAKVDTNKLIEAAKDFDLIITPEIIISHRKHIDIVPLIDENVRTNAKEAMKLIESDLPEKINEKQLLESNLKTLWGRRLYLEKEGLQNTKEYMDVIGAIEKHISLKLKMKGEIADSTVNISLSDIIKVPKVGKDDPNAVK